MRAKGLVITSGRILLIILSILAVKRSIEIAEADWIASAETIDGFARARQILPNEPRLLARAAIFENELGDSATIDADLKRAAQLNPLDSSVLMALGLREEFQGKKSSAEKHLLRAVDIDHQFKPAWTLANYYYRTNQSDRSWAMIERIFNLEPLGYSLTPVFDLCWKQSGDARTILGLIPTSGRKRIEYLKYLIATNRVAAALEVWPAAMEEASQSETAEVAVMSQFVDYLVGAGRVAESVMVWNRLVDRGMIRAGHINPAGGESIADPNFRFPQIDSVYGWHVAEVPGVFASTLPTPLRFQISGEEAVSFQLLTTLIPLVPSTKYRLTWKSDGSALNNPRDPGFAFHIARGPQSEPVLCPLLSRGISLCEFTSLQGFENEKLQSARLELRYERAPGTVRASGTLRILSVDLDTLK